jgi:hypothetical protein
MPNCALVLVAAAVLEPDHRHATGRHRRQTDVP